MGVCSRYCLLQARYWPGVGGGLLMPTSLHLRLTTPYAARAASAARRPSCPAACTHSAPVSRATPAGRHRHGGVRPAARSAARRHQHGPFPPRCLRRSSRSACSPTRRRWQGWSARGRTGSNSAGTSPHLVPTDMTSPVSSEARANGTMANQPVSSIATQAARNIGASWLVMPATTSARNATTAPIQPTENVI
jgi:hypothetical protein